VTTLLKFFTVYTFVLAQRTPLNAAFCTVGLDRIFEDRRITLPKRSEEAMLGLSVTAMEMRAKAGVGSFVDEAQRRRVEGGSCRSYRTARKIPKFGGAGRHSFAANQALQNPIFLSGVINYFLHCSFSVHIFPRTLKRDFTLRSEGPAAQRGNSDTDESRG
jgi:hypothetical protein